MTTQAVLRADRYPPLTATRRTNPLSGKSFDPAVRERQPSAGCRRATADGESPAATRGTQRGSDGMEVAQGLPIRPDQICLLVGDTGLFAVRLDEGLRFGQVRGGHRREQV